MSRRECALPRHTGPSQVAEPLHAELRLLGAVLRLRGEAVVPQPLCDEQGNALLWNGEVFGAPEVSDDECDTTVVLGLLAACLSVADVAPQQHAEKNRMPSYTDVGVYLDTYRLESELSDAVASCVEDELPQPLGYLSDDKMLASSSPEKQ